MTPIDEILDRFEQPARRGSLEVPPAMQASGTNPRCGDVLTMYALVQADTVAQVRFEGSGCTISQAAADVTAELAEGLPIAAALRLDLDALLARLGHHAVQTRLDCAALGLHTLQRALRSL
ncbi:MAG TPA: iron-sulfur cluster assembly scaffold protein [Chloroflexota bacterium]